MKALILNNVVLQVEQNEFSVSAPLFWLPCPANTQVGWPVIDGSVTEPALPNPPSLLDIKKAKLDSLSAFRYRKEIGGFSFNGQTVATDDRSKTLLLGARAIAEKALNAGEDFSMDYKSDAGFITINAETLIVLSDAVGSFVQSLFSVEKIHTEGILACDTELEVADYDFTEGWPV